MKGILGKLLDIDLTSGKTNEIGIADETAGKYLGGRGLGARLLFDLLPAKTDPLSADNPLIFLTGPFTGSMAPGSSKLVVVTKSPLTAGQLDGLELKFGDDEAAPWPWTIMHTTLRRSRVKRFRRRIFRSWPAEPKR